MAKKTTYSRSDFEEPDEDIPFKAAEPEPVPEVARPAEPSPAAAAALRSATEVEAAAQADAKKKKKSPEGSRASELSIMQQIARRMKRLPSDAARTRVAGWYAEEFGPKGGEPS